MSVQTLRNTSFLACVLAGALLCACTSDERLKPVATKAPAFSGQILHRWDFESGDAGKWSVYKLPTRRSLTIVEDPKQPGNLVARFTLSGSSTTTTSGSVWARAARTASVSNDRGPL